MMTNAKVNQRQECIDFIRKQYSRTEKLENGRIITITPFIHDIIDYFWLDQNGKTAFFGIECKIDTVTKQNVFESIDIIKLDYWKSHPDITNDMLKRRHSIL